MSHTKIKLTLQLCLSYLFVSIISINNLHAQEACGTTRFHEHMINNYPEIAKKYNEINEHALAFQKNPKLKRQIITIPIVFHIVGNSSFPNSSITDANINSIVTDINANFNKTNSSFSSVPAVFQAIAADCDFNFVLAKRTSIGCYTNGIERAQTTSVFDYYTMSSENVKFSSNGGLNAWPSDKYLNVWICDLVNSTPGGSGGTVTGYSFLPGTTSYQTDGIVLNRISPGGMSTTLTHEIGHWLNLNHTFCGQGDPLGLGASCSDCDYVSDTPVQFTSFIGTCPNFPSSDCPANLPNGANFNNFMSYSNCKAMFTEGQKARMLANFATGGFRVSMLTSQGANPQVFNYGNLTQNICNPGVITMSWSTSCPGGNGGTFNYRIPPNAWSSMPITSNPFVISLSQNTLYQYSISNVVSTTATSGSFTTLGSASVIADEPNNTKATAKLKTYPSGNYTNLSSTTDVDWYKFTVSAGAFVNAGISGIMTNSFNFTVENSAGVLQSNVNTYPNTAGNTDGSIVWEPTASPAAGTYYMKISYKTGQTFQNCPYWLSLGGLAKTQENLDISSIEDEKYVYVYPNPVSDFINIDCNYENSTITFYDLQGRVVTKSKLDTKTTNRIESSNLKSGIYLWIVSDFENNILEKGKVLKN